MSANGSLDDLNSPQLPNISLVMDLKDISPDLFGTNDEHKARPPDVRVRPDSVGPWSDDIGSIENKNQEASHAVAPKQSRGALSQAARQRPWSASQRPAPAQRPSSATTVSAARPTSATTRPTSATTRSTPLQPPGTAKRGSHASDEEESELLSSANIAAARYYAGLGESSARKRLVHDTGVARDVYRANDKDAVPHPPLTSWDQRESASSVPIFTPSRLHLRPWQNGDESLTETLCTSTGYCALRIPGFSQRLTQTEKAPRKSLLQKVLERGGGSALSFDTHARTAKHASDGAGVWRMGHERSDADLKHGNRADRNVGSSATKSPATCAPARVESRARRPADKGANEEVAGHTNAKGSGIAGGEWIPPTPRYPYYQDTIKGKEKDGEQVGLQVRSLRVHGTKEASAGEALRGSTEFRSSSAGFVRRPNSGKTVSTKRWPLSASVEIETLWVQDDSPAPPTEPRKRGAITIAELDRQLRLLEMQAKAEERGGPRLKRAGQTETDSADTYGAPDMPRSAARARGRKLQHPPAYYSSNQQSPLVTPRRLVRGGVGGDTPRSVGIQGSKASLLSNKGLSAGGAMEDEGLPFEVWSFQGKHQSFRRPHAPHLSTLAGESGKENEIFAARDSPRLKGLPHAPAHNVLKSTGGGPSFVNTRYADQSIFLRGKAVFAEEEDLGHFLSAKELASLSVKEVAPDQALAAAVEAGDELGQTLKERMVVPSLLQQMEQHSRELCDFVWYLLQVDSPDKAERFAKLWEGGDQGLSPDDSGDIWTNVSREARRDICEDVWVALTEQNMYVAPGTLNPFIPDLIPENMEFDEQRAVVSLLRLVIDRSVRTWWDNDPVAQQFSNLYMETARMLMPNYEHDPELEFQVKCQMKENLMVRALVIPSYLIAVMTSSLWLLPDLPVNRDEENRYWLKTCLLLRMHFVKGHLDSADSKWPTIQDAYWSVNEETRKGMDFSMFASGVLREEDEEISLREDEAAMVHEQDREMIEETRDRAGDGKEAGDSNSLLEADEFYQTQEGGGAEGGTGGTGGTVVQEEERGLDLTISLQGWEKARDLQSSLSAGGSRSTTDLQI